MRIAITLAAALLAAPAAAAERDEKPAQPTQAKGQEGQTSDPHPGEHDEPKNTKGYGYGTPAGTEANAVTSGAGDNNGYESNPANAHADDGVFAVDTDSGSGTQTSCTHSRKYKHIYRDYNISVPGCATISGIEVRLDARADATAGAPRICVQLSWNGGASWTSPLQTGTLTTSEATYTLGGAANTWGRSWSSAELSNANFRVRVINVASNSSRDFSLDWVSVKVTHQ